MAKRGDKNDSTQPLSDSQVVSVTPKPPSSPIAPHDQSVAWKGTVVSADEFAPPVKRGGRAKWAAGGALAVVAVGAGVYLVVPRSPTGAPGKLDAAATAPMATPPASDAALPDAAPPDAAAPVDAAELGDADFGDAAAPPGDAAASKPAKKSTKRKQAPHHKPH